MTTKCTPEMIQRICELVAAGAPLPLACPAANISWKTVQEWFRPENAEREPYATFVAGVERAKAAHAVGCTLRITKAAQKGEWKADLAILERRYGQYFGRPHRGQSDDDPALSGRTHGDTNDDPLSDAELEQIARGG